MTPVLGTSRKPGTGTSFGSFDLFVGFTGRTFADARPVGKLTAPRSPDVDQLGFAASPGAHPHVQIDPVAAPQPLDLPQLAAVELVREPDHRTVAPLLHREV